nr:ParA family protein [Burkholderia gladioli]
MVGGEKGGVGKSTLASNLAVHLAHHQVDVVLVDTDGRQPVLAHRTPDEARYNHPSHVCNGRGRGGHAARSRRRYQVIVVDAGGRDSRELRTALAVANLFLTPIRASQADLETLPKVNELIGLARGLNPDLKARQSCRWRRPIPSFERSKTPANCWPNSIRSSWPIP